MIARPLTAGYSKAPITALPPRQTRSTVLKKAVLAAAFAALPSMVQAGAVDVKDWPAVLEKAKGQTSISTHGVGLIASMPISIGRERR